MNMSSRSIEERLLAVLNNAKGWLSEEQLADMEELVRAGEPGVALENLCTQLEEYDVAVPDAVVDELRGIAAGMGMRLSSWMERGEEA
jgi:hypothetical protein